MIGDELWLRHSHDFPTAFAHDPEPPARLWTRGDRSVLAMRRVAIVGTRRCTAYGRNMARRLGAELAEAGVAVISGLAIGIDGAAHEGCLDAKGRPVGVVATGLDNVYPRRHAELWDRVGRQGLLMSEYEPNFRPERWGFPQRNRIIAALAELVVVVESTVKGGSMHTVNAAMARGVDVMAVPGPVGSPVSEGTNRLLVDGCHPVLSADEVVLALGLQTAPRLVDVPASPRRPRMSADAAQVMEVLDFVAMPTDRIVAASGLAVGSVLVALQELAAAGRATGGGGLWARAV